MNSRKILRQLLALLRAQILIYQDAHWEVTGPQSYGDHLLFERIYSGMLEQVDTLAEKMVSMFGPETVQAVAITQIALGWVMRWSKVKEFHQRGLQSEEDFEELAEMTYTTLDGEDQLSMGMDDFLMSLVNAHEQTRYLLLQSQRT